MTRFFISGILVLLLYQVSYAQQKVNAQVIQEKQPLADQGNGYYKNPIFPGNYGDPSIVTVGEDYYMGFSRGNGFMIWHSKDLINWKPIARHTLPKAYNTVWAIDLQYFDGLFHVYMPIRQYPGKTDIPFGNYVVTSPSPSGPWSDPIDLQIKKPGGDYTGIDPGFISTPGGEKYLYVSHGWVVKLNTSGTKAISDARKVYTGWDYPASWDVECKCLESPKLFRKGKYYYLISAQGGTNGPSTAHMTVVARSESPTGPWINSPYNPLTRTYSQDEPFWHQGHGTVFQAADKRWWTVYHGRLNGFEKMGRPTLLMPVEWTEDDWPVIKDQLRPGGFLEIPAGKKITHGMPLSDPFSAGKIGLQWNGDATTFENLNVTTDGLKTVENRDWEIWQYAVNKSFEVSVKLMGVSAGGKAGIKLGTTGICTDGENVRFADGPPWRLHQNMYPITPGKAVWLKIRNLKKDLSFYLSRDRESWEKFNSSVRSDDSYKIILFSTGDSPVIFKDFKYQGVE